MGVSENGGTPKSSILIVFSPLINHPFWGTPIVGNTQMGASHQTFPLDIPCCVCPPFATAPLRPCREGLDRQGNSRVAFAECMVLARHGSVGGGDEWGILTISQLSSGKYLQIWRGQPFAAGLGSFMVGIEV